MDHIEQIRTQKFSIGKNEPNPLIKDLHHAVTSLSAELYAKDVHFLMELIQNAEDNEYPAGVEPALEFLLTERDITGGGSPATLLIFNNEVGFSKENVDSVCSVGLSTKRGRRKMGFIGEKGIGFKSVFLVSSQPHVFSNGYQFRFNEFDERCGLGYIVPEWVSAEPSIPNIHAAYGTDKSLPATIIVLPLKPEKVEAVKAQLAELHPELLLFLTKIKRLSVMYSTSDPMKPAKVSIVSVSSETDHMELTDKKANSRMVQLSIKERVFAKEKSVSQDTCRYYLWRQAFPVKVENKITSRMDVEEWIITLAFPCQERLKRGGTSSVGVFAFLPTAMVTNFPFVIQADFVLASSREAILLDNKWNLGILACVPSAFVDAFKSWVQEAPTYLPLVQIFDLLPVTASPIPELDNVRRSIRALLRSSSSKIIPVESFCNEDFFCKPSSAIRVLPGFRKLLNQVKEQGGPLDCLRFLDKFVIHASLDLEKYRASLDFLGVGSIDDSYKWYRSCILSCEQAFLAAGDVYVELLFFVACNNRGFLNDPGIPLVQYINQEGMLDHCTIDEARRKDYEILYATDPELHLWLNQCNIVFGCPYSMFFLPHPTQRALVNHHQYFSFQDWLSYHVRVRCSSIYDYACELSDFVSDRKDTKLAVTLAQFLYHSYRKNFIDGYDLASVCKEIPVVDGLSRLRSARAKTLVPSSGSKWTKLLGPSNPFVEHHYIDLGDVYGESGEFSGECTSGKEVLNFLMKYCQAVDLEGLDPPNVALQVASSELTCEKALLLLDWIRARRTRGSSLPENFVQSIRNGKWLKTHSGFNSPTQSILPDGMGTVVVDMMKSFMVDTVVDQAYYMNRIGLYRDELKFLGVAFALEEVHKLVANRARCWASSALDKNQAFSLLLFVGYLKESNMLYEGWRRDLEKGKWLKTSQGYSAPKGSLLLQAEVGDDACLSITNVPVIDREFYGCKIASFASELVLLGVVSDMAEVYRLIAENIVVPLNLSLINRDTGLLLLKCIRHSGSTGTALIEKIRNEPWLKTCSGAKCPTESILLDPGWICLLNVIEVPIIDETFYGPEIRSFMAELKELGVAVEFDSMAKIVASHFHSLASSSYLTSPMVVSLLKSIRQIRQTLPLCLPGLHKCLSEFEWLKTRHGLKSPGETILSNPKWATISFFIDLPILDDSFYGISIYAYKEELKLMGVITDFQEGARFVARGLEQPIDPSIVTLTTECTISLLECIKFMMCNSNDLLLLPEFVTILRSSSWLKTHSGYSKPEMCVLFDPEWDGILKQTDAPIIDQTFYGTGISLFKNQLIAIGVKVDAGDVCSLLFGLLPSLNDTETILRIYNFLNKFKWGPDFVDKCSSKVWIPTPRDEVEGEWVRSDRCIVHDKNGLFGSSLYSLDRYFPEELLPIFPSAFGVLEFPSKAHYLELWNSWALRANCQVTLLECCTFWSHVLDKWNSDMENIMGRNLTHVPAVLSSGDEIYLVKKDEAFIPDDLQVQKAFSSVHRIPLFVWLPKHRTSPLIHAQRLRFIYHILGVRKISQSVDYILNCESLGHSEMVGGGNELVGKGLMKIILGFLAGPECHLPEGDRHKAAKSLLELSFYGSENPIQLTYRLKSESLKLEARKNKMVLWKKREQQMLVDEAGYRDRRSSIEFASCFAQEIARGLLARERPDLIGRLANMIQMAFAFEFKDDAVEHLLTEANLELFKEDTDFLDAGFSSSGQSVQVYKRLHTSFISELEGPSTPEATIKKQRKCK